MCGGGFFIHVRADGLAQVSDFGEQRDQTVTHFGFAVEDLRAFARRAGARGVDRVVPVGHGLAFDVIWDGYDLVGDYVRRVAVSARAQG